MASVGFNPDSNWINGPKHHTNKIDTFFTQRKVTETEDYIDQKNLERKEKQINKTYNFLAINFPHTNHKNVVIDVEIWGDNGFKHRGNINITDGDVQSLMLKLDKDTQMFIKLIYRNIETNQIYDTYIDFVPILKRYQSTPSS